MESRHSRANPTIMVWLVILGIIPTLGGGLAFYAGLQKPPAVNGNIGTGGCNNFGLDHFLRKIGSAADHRRNTRSRFCYPDPITQGLIGFSYQSSGS